MKDLSERLKAIGLLLGGSRSTPEVLDPEAERELGERNHGSLVESTDGKVTRRAAWERDSRGVARTLYDTSRIGLVQDDAAESAPDGSSSGF